MQWVCGTYRFMIFFSVLGKVSSSLESVIGVGRVCAFLASFLHPAQWLTLFRTVFDCC